MRAACFDDIEFLLHQCSSRHYSWQGLRTQCDQFVVCCEEERAFVVLDEKACVAAVVLFETGDDTPFIPSSMKWWNFFAWVKVFGPDQELERSLRLLKQRLAHVVPEVHVATSAAVKALAGFEEYARVVRIDPRRWTGPVKTPTVTFRPFSDSRADRDFVMRGLNAVYDAEGHAEDFQDVAEQLEELNDFVREFKDSTLIAEDEAGETVGFFSASLTQVEPCGLSRTHWGCAYVNLDYIYVGRPGKGYAAAMMGHMVAEALRDGIGWIHSSFEVGNAKSLKWHAIQQFDDTLFRVFRGAV